MKFSWKSVWKMSENPRIYSKKVAPHLPFRLVLAEERRPCQLHRWTVAWTDVQIFHRLVNTTFACRWRLPRANHRPMVDYCIHPKDPVERRRRNLTETQRFFFFTFNTWYYVDFGLKFCVLVICLLKTSTEFEYLIVSGIVIELEIW